MLKIGNVKIDGVVALGPMAGITNEEYRRFLKPYGVALSYTEMISDCGIIYNNQETISYLPSQETDRPLALQLFGGRKETLLQALQIIEDKKVPYDILDINLGCPMPKVTKTGSGASWLKRPAEMFEMIKEIVACSSKPVTAKIRLGWDEEKINFEEVVTGLEKAGVAAIALHSRTRAQVYSGKAKHELIRDLRKKMSIPLIISGDIFSLDDAIKVQEMTKADMIMVARGGVGNPKLITQIDCYFRNRERIDDATLKEQLNAMRNLLNQATKNQDQRRAVNELRGILPKFLTGFPHTKKYRVEITQKATTIDELLKIVEKIELERVII
ncbi:MAG: tRNA dihydrouridine synthase [Bacilli bacterium]|jgi:tRNA-dihydrouridine synthase B